MVRGNREHALELISNDCVVNQVIPFSRHIDTLSCTRVHYLPETHFHEMCMRSIYLVYSFTIDILTCLQKSFTCHCCAFFFVSLDSHSLDQSAHIYFTFATFQLTRVLRFFFDIKALV